MYRSRPLSPDASPVHRYFHPHRLTRIITRRTGHDSRDRGTLNCSDRSRPLLSVGHFHHATRSFGDRYIRPHHSQLHGANYPNEEVCYDHDFDSRDIINMGYTIDIIESHLNWKIEVLQEGYTDPTKYTEWGSDQSYHEEEEEVAALEENLIDDSKSKEKEYPTDEEETYFEEQVNEKRFEDYSRRNDERRSPPVDPMSEPENSVSPLGDSSSSQIKQQSSAAVVNKYLVLKKHDFEVSLVDGVPTSEVPSEVISDSIPVWDNFMIGRFHSTAPHVAKIHVIVNKIWPLGDKTVRIGVFEHNSTSVRFHIRDPSTRLRVLQRVISKNGIIFTIKELGLGLLSGFQDPIRDPLRKIGYPDQADPDPDNRFMDPLKTDSDPDINIFVIRISGSG
ncbi:hypothetical protein ISN44_As09g008680 [Arabidopsis suecica]|uniref:DUF4283 domain-containing protein n=1 Tax=Arabidopsis suecica TaxID=45249 RepID=A0A8T2AG95_ARASU|nr:hypothetical protein ISN44_As09g008680 [Arabidopsis suecica]